MMKKSANNEPPAFTPFFISTAIHILFMLLVLIISYRNYTASRIAREEADREIQIETIVTSENSSTMQSETAPDLRKTNSGAGTGPYGLNDSAGRELVESARSGITITPDNFLEYAKLRDVRKGLNPERKKTILEKYPILTGTGHFDIGTGHKLKSDFQECYENVCRIIDIKEENSQSLENKSNNFTTAVLDYLDGKRPVSTWRTLWMVKKPALVEDKVNLVRLIRRLHNYSRDREDSGYEYMRKSFDLVVILIPNELKFPAISSK